MVYVQNLAFFFPQTKQKKQKPVDPVTHNSAAQGHTL